MTKQNKLCANILRTFSLKQMGMLVCEAWPEMSREAKYYVSIFESYGCCSTHPRLAISYFLKAARTWQDENSRLIKHELRTRMENVK